MKHTLGYWIRRLEHDEFAVLSVLDVGPDNALVPQAVKIAAKKFGGPRSVDPRDYNRPMEKVCEVLCAGVDYGAIEATNIAADHPGWHIPGFSLTPEGFQAVVEEEERRGSYSDPQEDLKGIGLVHPRFGRLIFRPHPATLHALSLGAGVQSTAIALMVAEGVISRPDCAIFSDTGWEPAAVYRHLDWLERVVPFPVHRVTGGNIRHDMMSSALDGARWAGPPLYTLDASGSKGRLRRLCTREYKLLPIMRKVKELFGLRKGQHVGLRKVEQWLGISTDENQRARPADETWVRVRWPLLELDVSRQGCVEWMSAMGYPIPPRSSCIGCPYHSDAEWARMKRDRPDEWEDACLIDDTVREGVRGTTDLLFTHRSRQPLRGVQLLDDKDYDPVATPDCGCAEEISDIWED